MRFMKLAYAIFYSLNLDRVRSFYERDLGLSFAFGDDTFIAFHIGDALLGIKKSEIAREIPGHQTVIFLVSDVDAWYKKAEEKGYTIFSSLQDEEWGRNFSILDPDGNRVEFFSEKEM